ncbi:MAG: N-acetyl-gamma-glutamyl-phosphate reductase [Thermodesulfobacteriota bacterium]
MQKIAIVGASGYTGLELLRILSHHPDVEIECITSRQHKGRKVSDVFPALKKISDKTFIELNNPAVLSNVSLVFVALPHSVSMTIIPNILEMDKKVIDLSADFRLRDRDIYEQWYGKHLSPEFLEEAVYGLPELYREGIKQKRLIANPGCYAAASILGLAPLIKEQLIEEEDIVIDAKSGVSGAGRVLSSDTSFVEVNEGFKAYKVGGHRHTPEIEQELSLLANKPVRLTFTPHLLPVTRGILATIYATVKENISYNSIRECFEETYENEGFIRVLPPDNFPNIAYVRGSNYCDIGIRVDKRTGKAVIITDIDNLVKGAAGSAVQNMNIIYGFPEDLGLSATVYP